VYSNYGTVSMGQKALGLLWKNVDSVC